MSDAQACRALILAAYCVRIPAGTPGGPPFTNAGAARARAIYDRAARERRGQRSDMVENMPPCSTARDAAGKAGGVSGKSVDYATKVLTKGVPGQGTAQALGRGEIGQGRGR